MRRSAPARPAAPGAAVPGGARGGIVARVSWVETEPTAAGSVLRLDVGREEALAGAAAVIAEAWRSFDRFRVGQPPLDRELAVLLREGLPAGASATATAIADAARALDESIAQPRPRYFAFIGSSGLEIGVIADALAACYDVNLAVWAGAASEVELQAVRWAGEFVGFPAEAGSFTSGGTISNLTALTAARERALPGARHHGLNGTPSCPLLLRRGALLRRTRGRAPRHRLRAGSAPCRSTPTGGCGRTPSPRRSTPTAADGIVPVAVVATAGTTLTGAVDPIDGLADCCAERNVWLHVDGAYGLPAARVPSAAPLFRGLERADSVTIDAHKWLYLPKACGVVLVRRKADLQAALGHEGAYLPHDREEAHAADITLEYSRPFRALKLWLALRVHGADAFRAAIGRNLDQARLLYHSVVERPELAAPRRGAAALRRPVPPRPGRRRRPRRAQRRDRPATAGRRRVLGRPCADRRQHLHPAVHRQLPDDRGRRGRIRRARATPRAGTRAMSAPVEQATPRWHPVGPARDEPDGSLRRIEVDGRAICLGRVEGAWAAFDDTCTHAACSLAGGELDGPVVVCPCHGSEFDVRTGDVLSPPALEPLPIFSTRVEAGVLEVRSEPAAGSAAGGVRARRVCRGPRGDRALARRADARAGRPRRPRPLGRGRPARVVRAPPPRRTASLAGRARRRRLLVAHPLRRHRRRGEELRGVLVGDRRYLAPGSDRRGTRAAQVDDRHRPAAAHAGCGRSSIRASRPGSSTPTRPASAGSRARSSPAPASAPSSTGWRRSPRRSRCGSSPRSWASRSRTGAC